MSGRSRVLARYTDPHRKRHRVVLRGRLVLDLSAGDMPRVVAVLGDDEGEAQARGLLDGSEIDDGYLDRMRRESQPICRTLSADDTRRRTIEPQYAERRRAA